MVAAAYRLRNAGGGCAVDLCAGLRAGAVYLYAVLRNVALALVTVVIALLVVEAALAIAGYPPDLVVVLFCVNDIWYNNRATYPRGAKPVFRLAGRDSLVLTGVPVPRPLATVTPPPQRSVKAWLVDHSHLLRLAQRALHRSP